MLYLAVGVQRHSQAEEEQLRFRPVETLITFPNTVEFIITSIVFCIIQI